jgi:hypothetical protein
MKTHILLAALVASVAFAAPADAASKKKKKVGHRAPISAVHSKAYSNDVYVGGEYQGRDPDPSIRAFMMRSPGIWDGPN